MKRAYGTMAWGIIALGVLHMAATWHYFHTLSASALWFFSGGIALVFTGSVNLLNRAYGAVAPGLRWFCRTANVGMSGFTVVGGLVTRASGAQLAIVLGLMGTVTVLSWIRSPVGSAHRAG